MRGEGCSKLFDEVINRLDESKKIVNSQFKHLFFVNAKHGQCKDKIHGVLLLKNKSRKRSQKTEQKEATERN